MYKVIILLLFFSIYYLKSMYGLSIRELKTAEIHAGGGS